jgi:hypothetical protein
MIEGEFKLNMRYKQGYTGILVGQCRELPFIIVEGNTPDDLVKEMAHELEVYFNTFSEEGIRFIQQQEEKSIIEKEQIEEKKEEEGWMEKKIEIPIPIR